MTESSMINDDNYEFASDNAEIKPKTLVYVAGPYRGKTRWQVEKNIRAAEDIGFQLAESFGITPVVPHTMFRHFGGELTDQFWLEGTLELMRRCDAVVLLDTWKESSGAKGEREEALNLDMPVFDLRETTALMDFRMWLMDR